MKMRYCLYVLCCVMLLGMASCSSSRKASVEAPLATSAWKDGEAVVAKGDMRLSVNGGKDTKLSVTLRMKRNDVIQVNATYFLGIQIGTVELTRDSVLVVSRATRQYAVVKYPELSLLLGRGVTFDDMQNIFWGEASEFKVKGVDWKYGSFVNLQDGRRLPNDVSVKFSRASTSVNLRLSVSDYRFEDDWISRTKVNSSNYTFLTTEQIVGLLKMLMGH